MDVLAIGLSSAERATLVEAAARMGVRLLPEATPGRLARPEPLIALVAHDAPPGLDVERALKARAPTAWVVALQSESATRLPEWADDAAERPLTLERATQRLGVAQKALARVALESDATAPPEGPAMSTELSPNQHAALLELAATVTGDRSDAMRQVLRTASAALFVARASFWSWQEAPVRLQCEGLYDAETGTLSRGETFHGGDAPAYFEALQHATVIAASDAQRDPRTRDYADAYLRPRGITSVLDTPVWTRGRLAGVVSMEHVGPPRQWRDAEQRFAVSIAQVLSLMLEVGERRRVEANLAQTEGRFHHLLSSTRELVWSVSADGTWTYANDASARRLLGKSAAELVGTPFVAASGSTSRHALLGWLVRLLNGESPEPLEVVHRRPDDVRVPLRFQGMALHDERGRISGVTGTATEITGLRQGPGDLARFRTMLDRAVEAILIVRASDATVLDANETAERWLGPAEASVCGSSVLSLGLFRDVGSLREWHARLHGLGREGQAELFTPYWLRRTDGTTVSTEISLTVHPVDGEALVVVVVRDITERRRRELEAQLFRFAMDHAAETMYRVDPAGRIQDCNETACQRLGYDRETLCGLSVWDIDHGLDREGWPAFWEDLRRLRRAEITGEHMRADASTIPVETSLAFFVFDGVESAFAFARDITARLEAESRIRAQDERLRAIIRSMPGVVYAYRTRPDAPGIFEFLSDRARELLDIDPTQVPVTMPIDRVLPEDLPLVRQQADRARRGNTPWFAEFRVRMADGAIRWLRGESLPGPNEADGTRLWNGVLTDITERKALELQVHLASNLAAVGTLAAGVAHEINNPLAYVTGNLSFALEALGQFERPGATVSREEMVRALEEALDGSRRVAAIVADLKTFSRADERVASAVPLAHVLDAALRMTANQRRYRAELVDERGRLPLVHGQESRLAQVFVNLLINAVEAMPPGREASKNVVRLSTAIDGERVLVRIEDNGEGMSPHVLQRIFDPFFTTKPQGMGTGLGLSVCHGIVHAVGGEIRAESEPGRGTSFTVTLRIAERPPEQRAADVTPSGPGPRRRILFVDDDPMVLKAVERLLKRDHDLVEVPRAQDALALLRAGERFDLIISDIMMPDCTGAELYETIAREVPEMLPRVYMMTGGAFTESLQTFADGLGDRLLDKAADLPRLRQLVNVL